MPDKVISLDRLGNYDIKLKELASLWNKSTAYSLNKIVQFQGTYLKCTTAGTSGSTTLDLSTISNNQITDGTCVWEVVDPFTSSVGTTISDWVTATSYSVGDLVINDNCIYQCNTAHTSTTFSTDAINWTLLSGRGLSEDLYTSSTWIDTDSNITLSSAITPYDLLLFKIAYSVDGTNTEVVNTVVVKTDVNDVFSLSYIRNSSNRCIVEGSIISSTSIAIDVLELVGFTKFKIEKITGMIGGGGGSVTLATSSQISSLF